MLYDYQKIFGSREAKIRFTGKNDAIASPTRTQKADLQIYKSGAETNIRATVRARVIHKEREHARPGSVIPVAAAQRKPFSVIPTPEMITAKPRCRRSDSQQFQQHRNGHAAFSC